MNSSLPLPDESQRVRVRTSPASLALEASAGTGKTYLLVIRALWLIMVRKIEPEHMVALAFGEQAATELKQRLRAKLDEIVQAPAKDALDREVLAMLPTEPLTAIQERARDAMDALDRAHISTIHAFASTILRLYPAESRVDPGFAVVEDVGFSEVVEDEWSRFIAGELGEGAQRREQWLGMLARVKLADLFELGSALADYDTDLTALPTTPTLSVATKRWLEEVAEKAEAVHGRIRETKKKARDALAGFAHALRETEKTGQSALTRHKDAVAAMAEVGKADLPKELELDELKAFNAVSTAAKALRAVPDEGLIFAAVNLLLPFAVRARERLRLDGKLTYSGLLALARDLLRDHPGIRTQLKRRFRAILLDEAQDVDPVQLEIVLFLSESPFETVKDWRDVTLENGKLFVVGDHKQSIYLFRGADVRAFRATIGIMESHGAERLAPTTSMRSADRVLASVNAVGQAIFTDYPALAQRPGREEAKTGAGAEVLIVEPAEGEDPLGVEAEAVARRIGGLIEGGLDPAEIAVLFRKRTPMPAFARALRAGGIEVTIEQERRFYLRQEIMDLINAVKLIADPQDQVARLGVLRGPYTGVMDSELERSFRETEIPTLFGGEFGGLRAGLLALPAQDWVENLYAVLGAESVAEASNDGDARDAVRAFRSVLSKTLETYGIPKTLELLDECIRVEGNQMSGDRPPLTPPPSPATAEAGAVRFLTVHNAKGLEFPAVILADIDARPQQQKSTDTGIQRDWAGGTHGITLRALGAKEAAATLDGCRLKAMQDQEERMETARLVYVALTRAKDRLIVVDRRPNNGKRPSQMADTFRPHLAALIEFPNSPATRNVSRVTKAGKYLTEQDRRELPEPAVPEIRKPLESEADLVSPTELDERIRKDEDSGDYLPAGTRSAKQWLGELCHEILRDWDFKTEDDRIAELLPDALDKAQARIGGPRSVPDGIRRQALDTLAGFLKSGAGRRLRRSEILGREVPMLSTLDGRVVSARADVIYSTGQGIRIADYKLSAASDPAGEVARTYAATATSSLGTGVEFEVLPLASHEIVTDR